MFFQFVCLFILAIGFFAVQRTYLLTRNYLVARKIGIPVIVVPFSADDIWWIFTRKYFAWVERLPWVGEWYQFSYNGWTLHARYSTAHKYGDALVLVTAQRNQVFINDPHACSEVLSRYKTWIKPVEFYSIFNNFGGNVISANGHDWQRHRKIMGPAFREQNNRLVWDESIRQARQMVKGFVDRPQSTATLYEVRQDCVYIAMHVLSAAGFGHRQEFEKGLRSVPPGYTKSFADTTMFLLNNILWLFLVGDMQVPGILQPSGLVELKSCMAQFRRYMKEAITYTKETAKVDDEGNLASADIISTLLQANETAKREEKNDMRQRDYLSDDELMGDLFIVNLAGFETTAGTLTYTMPYLAAQPEIQEWVGEELDKVLKGEEDWDYEAAYPELVRCSAIMMETLRIWGPNPTIARAPDGEPATITIKGRDIVVPPEAYINIDYYSIHTDPRLWGPDSLEYRPQRWVKTDPVTGKEYIVPPPDGAVFIPWATGPRICPGKKFSQVEFVAVIATMLKNHRLKPDLINGNRRTRDEAGQALINVIKNSEWLITPRIKRPQDASVIIGPK